MIYLFFLVSLLASAWAESRLIEPPLRVDFAPPVETRSLRSNNVFIGWIDMPIDHFDPQNRDTYQMRYMYNEEFFGGNGKPVFILVGGEWDIVPGWLQAGNMYLMAQENQGYQIYTEHRYYGESLPYQNFTTENLRFLNVDQALADLAYFISDIKQQPRFANSKVVLYGGSYAANMVLWFKQRYPHLAVGGVASSGPIKAQVDFTELCTDDLVAAYVNFKGWNGPRIIICSAYLPGEKEDPTAELLPAIRYARTHKAELLVGCDANAHHTTWGSTDTNMRGYLEVVHQAFLSEGGESCIAVIREGIAETIAAMATEDGRRNLERVYRVCEPLKYDSPFDMGYFSGLISWSFSTSVQQARPGTLRTICNNFANNYYGLTPMEQIGGYIANSRNLDPESCWNMDYAAYIRRYRENNNNSRAWYYQTCTEYGYYQTAPRIGTVFDQLVWLSVAFYVDTCKQAFNEKFDEAYVYDAVERVNLVFGALQPDVNNTINIHGSIDPWHALGVHDRDLKEGSPTITVPRASHCFDMSSWRVTDTIRMTAAQQFARRMVAQWLSVTN